MKVTLRILFLAMVVLPSVEASDAPPNIIVILADDMGYGDPQCYQAASKCPTPNLNRLAEGGMRFTDAHTPSSVCTPTRYTLLTGRYCWRTRLKSSVFDGFSPPLIENDQVTLPSLLHSQGYRTACFGKWHLGMQWTRRDGSLESDDRAEGGFRSGEQIDFSQPLSAGPLTCGFDSFFGISASLDMPPYCWIEDDRCRPKPDGTVETDRTTIFLNQVGGAAHSEFHLEDVLPTLEHRTVAWLNEHAGSGKPFFLYLPLNSPHLPVTPSRSFQDKSGAGAYADFVEETDHFVGAVLDTLEAQGALENTLLLFTSDNGGLWHEWDPVEADDLEGYRPTPRALYNREFGHRSNAHLRGTKADIWEGGHRVPFLVHWPARVAPGTTSDALVELTDVLATCAEAVQVNLPTGAGEDSFSFLSALTTGEEAISSVRPFAIHHSLRGMFAIRKGPWKLVEGRGSGGFTRPRELEPEPGSPKGQLYRLDSDPQETRNVYLEQPEIVTDLTRDLELAKSAGLRTQP